MTRPIITILARLQSGIHGCALPHATLVLYFRSVWQYYEAHFPCLIINPSRGDIKGPSPPCTNVGCFVEHVDETPRQRIPPWRRHDKETLSTLLALCEGNPPVTDGFPSQWVSNVGLWFLLLLAWISSWTNDRVTVICDTMTPIWRHSHGITDPSSRQIHWPESFAADKKWVQYFCVLVILLCAWINSSGWRNSTHNHQETTF